MAVRTYDYPMGMVGLEPTAYCILDCDTNHRNYIRFFLIQTLQPLSFP